MRILFLALTDPFPPTNGHRLRTWSMLQSLAADGHELSLVVLADEEGAAPADGPLRTLCASVERVATARPAGWRQYAARARAVVSRLPYGVWRLRSLPVRTRVEEALARGGVDAVFCDGVYAMINVPDRPGVPVILNKDDVAHVILERYVALETARARRAYAALEARKVRAWERDASSRATVILACSQVDATLLRALAPATDVVVVPNVVDTAAYAPAGDVAEPVVLFQGGMDWHPNRDAVEYFAGAIWPALRALAPDAVFRVAGRGPDGAFRRRMEAAGVQFTGTVADMRAEIARAAVCVVPLRIGSGTRLKILEAAAMARPIVSTALGAEGLDLVADREIVLADDPAAFARAVAVLLVDPGARRTLGAAARCRVEALYSRPVLEGAMRAALARLSAPARGRAASDPARADLEGALP